MAHYLSAILLTEFLLEIVTLWKKVPYILLNFIEIFFNIYSGFPQKQSHGLVRKQFIREMIPWGVSGKK